MNVEYKVNSRQLVKKVVLILLGCNLTLLLADIFLSHYSLIKLDTFRRLLNMAREDGLCNWYSSFQLMIVAMTAWLLYFKERNLNSEEMRKKGWFILALFFTYLAIDEGAAIHERFTTAFDELAKGNSGLSHIAQTITHRFPTYTWQIVFGPLLIFMAAYMTVFLFKVLHTRTLKILFLTAVAIYGLSQGFDALEGYQALNQKFSALLHMQNEEFLHFVRISEEFFELCGTTCFLLVFLKTYFNGLNGIQIKLEL